MGTEAATKAFIICKPQDMLILLGQNEVSRLYCLSLGYSNKRKTNQGHT